MKKYGIGTDATMQEHIHTNIERKYFIVKNKRLIPTPLGRTLAVSLYETVPELVLPEIRGRMESKLVKIANGEVSPEELVQEMLEEFLSYYDKLAQNIDKVAEKLVEGLKKVYQEENSEASHTSAKKKSSMKRRKTTRQRKKI